MRKGGGAGTDVPPYEEGYNVADYLLEISSESPNIPRMSPSANSPDERGSASPAASAEEKRDGRKDVEALSSQNFERAMYAATFLTQLQVLCGREWKILRRCALFNSRSA
jgi:hypothetical protein